MRTQVDRLRDYLRDHPGASSLEITIDLAIVNVTGRVSDLRAIPGVNVDCRRRLDGRDGYWLTEGDSRPGYANFRTEDSPRQIDRKMAEATSPIAAALEAWERVFGGDS